MHVRMEQRQAGGQQQTSGQWFKASETLLPCLQRMTTHPGLLLVHAASAEAFSVQAEDTA